MKIACLFFLILSLFVFTSVGCGPSFDEQGFEVVEDYAEEIIPAVDVAIHSLYGWDADPTDDNLEELYQFALEIEGINERYWVEDKIPSYDIEEWHIMRGRGDPDDPHEEWEVVGEELADAVYLVEADSWWVAARIIELHEAGGDLQARGEDAPISLAEDLVRSSQAAEDSINELRRILFNR